MLLASASTTTPLCCSLGYTMDPPTIEACIDFASTGPRAVWSLASARQPHLCYIEPDVVEVPAGSIDRYLRNEIGEPTPEDAAWVCLDGQFWACGRLARQFFGGEIQISLAKVDLAVYQTLAVVGSICQRRDLPRQFDLHLGVLLPFGEYLDRVRLQDRLAAALAHFSFRGRDYECALTGFHATVEGGGLLAKGMPDNLRAAPQRGEVLVATLGFRNCSRLAIYNGQRRGETDNFGFAYVMQRVQQASAGQRFDDPQLIAAASQSTPERRAAALMQLARSRDEGVRTRQAEELAVAVETARQEYFKNLARRFLAFSPQPPQVILFGGGTAWHCRNELRDALRPYYPRTKFEHCTALRQRCQDTLQQQLQQRRLSAHRVLDAYGYFLMLLEQEFTQTPEVAVAR